MSTDPEAKLFYGYITPSRYDKEDDADDEDDNPWSSASYGDYEGCTVGVFGYDADLRHYLCIKASLRSAEWSDAQPLDNDALTVGVGWDVSLRQAADHWNLDVPQEAKPHWHLVSLYF